jgi:hypothetical protein
VQTRLYRGAEDIERLSPVLAGPAAGQSTRELSAIDYPLWRGGACTRMFAQVEVVLRFSHSAQ